jgi:hypothetical protein
MNQNLITQWNQKHYWETNLYLSTPGWEKQKDLLSPKMKSKLAKASIRKETIIKIMAEINQVEKQNKNQ